MVVFRFFLVVVLLTAGGMARADFAAGLAAYERGDFEAAYAAWLPLAEAGDAEAQFRVGRLYHKGEGRQVDGAKAASWYGRAYKEGSVKAAYNLGNIFFRGDLLSSNYEKAKALYAFAAEAMHGSAQLHLGFMYMAGKGVERDFVEAYKWFYLAEKFGSANAHKAIEKFEQYTTKQDRRMGREAYREWLKEHSR